MTLVIWMCTKEPTRVKNLKGAQHATFPALDTLIWNDTCWGIIQEKNLTSATSAIMLAPLQLTCRGTWESKIYWDLSSATSQCNASCTCNNSLKRHAQTQNWSIIQEKCLTRATRAIMLASLQVSCRVTWESTLYWDLSSAPSAMQVSNWTSLLWTMYKLTM